MKIKYKRTPAPAAPLAEGTLTRMLDPESRLAIEYPHAYAVMRDLHGAGIAIREVSQIQYATKMRVLGGCVVLLYWSGKTVVQGNAFKGGAIWEILKDVLPENTVWQR